MDIPPPAALLDSVRSLPPGRPLVERLRDQSGVHLVGGAVRDLLLGGAPTDLDLVVEGSPDAVISRLGGRVTVHERFGTWAVDVDGYSYDIARARRESYAHPGALPDVEPATLAEDLARRDFTVNALALALGGPQAGALTAGPRTLEDLAQRRLAVLHDRSFIDDPTRLLRLARYRSRLGFAVEDETARLAASAVQERALDTVSGSRVGAELRLLAREPDPLAALAALNDLGLDQAIDAGFGLQTGDLDLGRRALGLIPPEGRPDRLALGLAARRIPRAELVELLDRLAFEAEDREAITATASRADRLARSLEAARRPSEVAEAARGEPLELVALAGALGPESAARCWLEQLRHVRLDIGGSDLLEAGVEQGPAIGRGLEAALAAKLDGRAQDREAELAVALEAARGRG
jgi:tRNA nucleotidyltransferase (CCA-adding enzyme)